MITLVYLRKIAKKKEKDILKGKQNLFCQTSKKM